MSHSVAALVQQYGYAVVAALVCAEGLGLPLPGETALLTAAALAARGHLMLPWVIVAASVGVALGGIGGYWIGHTAGCAVITRYGRWVGITEPRLDQARRFFDRHGAAAVLFGRFLPVIRILTGIVAGITRMAFPRFATVNALAGVLWSILYGVLGYTFGRNMDRFEHQFGRAGLFVLLGVAVAAAAFMKWRETRHPKPRGLSET